MGFRQAQRVATASGRPLVFFGQVAVEGFFHDRAAAYVFYDPATGSCETVVQVM